MRELLPSRPRAAALPFLFFAACTVVGVDYAPPEAPAPAEFRERAESGLVTGPAELDAWWTKFGDPTLDALVARAAERSLDLREALAALREARALRGVAAAARYPTLDGVAEYRRAGESENTPLGGFVPDSDYHILGLEASWEVDLWGRVARSVEAAEADLAARAEDVRAVSVAVIAQTVIEYVRLRDFQHRAAIARSNVALQEQTLALVRARLDAGLVRERDVAQAATNVESTRSRVPSLEAGVRAAENRLAVLLGLPPGALAEELADERPIPVPPAAIAIGVPADLLRRRADVRAAERALAAETARIGVAEGDLFPRLSIVGSLGVSSARAEDLFASDSAFFGIGPSLRWNLFDGGRLRNLVRAQEAVTEQALVRWERTVLTALEEAENAMTGFLREQERRRSLAAAVAEGRRAAQLAQAQYREGLSDFQTVLDSERTLADLEDELTLSEGLVAANAVGLYRALGGGWEHRDPLAGN